MAESELLRVNTHALQSPPVWTKLEKYQNINIFLWAERLYKSVGVLISCCLTMPPVAKRDAIAILYFFLHNGRNFYGDFYRCYEREHSLFV